MKAVFFDVDGTLTSTKSGQAFKQYPEDVLVFPGVEAGLAFHKSQGYQLIAVSNQGGVAARHKTMDEASPRCNTHSSYFLCCNQFIFVQTFKEMFYIKFPLRI